MGTPRIDLTKTHIGDWYVISYVGGPHAKWLCRCVCGVEREVNGSNLRRPGGSGGCSCRKAEKIGKTNTHHGHSAGGTTSPEYVVWRAILARCTNPNNHAYADYGGRGVKVHPAWVESFATFLADVGPRPSPKHTIDRFPVADGDYIPTNCRWATAVEQNNNRGDYNYRVTVDGFERTVAEWAATSGIAWHTIKNRLNSGWDPKRAVSEPSRGSFWKGKRRKD